MKPTSLILCLLLCCVCWAANDPSGDPNCVGWWRMETWDTQTPDGTSNANDLSVISITHDDTHYYEGSYGAQKTAGTGRLARNDISLSENFPGKNGEGNTSFSFVGWVYWDTNFLASGEFFHLCSKYVTNKRQYCCYVMNDSGTHKVILTIGYNSGVDYENVITYTGLTFSADQWYHCAYTYNGSTRGAHIRVWDDSGETVYDDTDTGSQTISDAEDEAFRLMNSGFFNGNDGHLDEAMAFNDILTSEEIDQIRSGTYTPGIEPSPGFIGHILGYIDWSRFSKKKAA